jgi:hypothetical protein
MMTWNRAGRSFIVPASFQFLKAVIVESAHLPYSGGGSLRPLRVVFGLPRSGGFPQDLALPAELDFALGQLGQERAPAVLADQLIDVGDHVNRKDDVRSSAQTLGRSHSDITTSGVKGQSTSSI